MGVGERLGRRGSLLRQPGDWSRVQGRWAGAPTRAPRRGLGGRAEAGAAGSPSDGEMWPFTFTLQCQHLNHCRSARAQGCSREAANKAAAGPPPPPGRPEEGTPAAPRRTPRLPLRAPSPSSSSFSLSLLSQSPILGTGRPQCPLQTQHERPA